MNKLSAARREASRHFRNTKKGYLKDKINELESNSKNKKIRDLYRGVNEFNQGYHPRINLVKDERGDLVADPHKILNRWNNYFCQLLNVQGAGGVRQTEMHTTEPFVAESSANLHIGELHNMQSSKEVIRQIKSRRIRWAGHVARIGKEKRFTRILWESSN
jgi:hypothetical protein